MDIQGWFRWIKFEAAVKELNVILLKIIIILFILVVMYLTIKIGSYAINRATRKKGKISIAINEKKAKTLGAVLKSLLRYIVYFFGAVAILTQFGPVSLTLAGIGGVAIGFGAQNIIKDVLNGFFILFEDQFSVGDFIETEGKSGIVESIELRVTRIRDFNGDLHIVPNGLITKVTNHSRGAMRMMLDVDVSLGEDMDKIIKVINEVCIKFSEGNVNIVDEPKVSGIINIKENSYTVRVIGKVKPMTQGDCECSLRMCIKKAMDIENIQSPHTKIEIIKES